MCFLCISFYSRRWRHNRPSVLTAAQYERVKKIFLETVPRFFPAAVTYPVFVVLQPHVELHIEKLHLPDPHAVAAAAGVGAGAREAKEPGAAPARAAADGVHPRLPLPRIDMDAGLKVKDFVSEEKIGHDLQRELAAWFVDEKQGSVTWNQRPEDMWKVLEPTFPLLALLARRFLTIQATSAACERVWSGLGKIIGPQSTHIDSILAAQIAFLRQNKEIRALIQPSLPPGEDED